MTATLDTRQTTSESTAEDDILGHSVLGDSSSSSHHRPLSSPTDRHLHLLNSVPGIMYEYKMNHATGQSSFPYVSEYCEEMLGVSAASVMADPSVMINLIHPEDVAPFTAAVVTSMTEMSMFDHSMRMKHAGSDQFMIIYDKSLPVRTEERNPATGLFEIFTTWKGFIFTMGNHRLVPIEEEEDGTPMEVDNAVSSELQELMDSNFLHFFALDLKGFVKQWNSAMSATTGYTSDMAQNSPFLSYVADQDKVDVSNFLASVIRNEQENIAAVHRRKDSLQKLSCALMTADERQLDFVITAKGQRDAANNLIGLYVLAQDVTSVKQIERQRNDAMRLAESEKALTEWLSHEIRNPLSVAMEAAQALEAMATGCLADDGGASYLQLIRRSITYVVEILTNTLDLNKFAEGKIVMRPENCSIHQDILVPTQDMMFLSKAGKVTVDVVGEDVGLYVDKLRLKQVVTNLVSNAIKYTTEGFIRMQVKAEDERQVVITVSDSGIGVKPSEYHNLFSRWEQLGSSINGAGIGLCLCKSLVSAMGGSISLNKEYHSGIVGHPGAQFVVRLPRRQRRNSSIKAVPAFHALAAALTANNASMVQKQQQLDAAADRENQDVPPVPSDATLHGRFRILVVDDERMGQKLLVRRFSRIFPHATVECASSGERALEMVQTKRYDIITMDHFMKVGEMTGEETIRAMRTQAGVDALIVGISGNSKRDAHLAAGADDFFQKPLPSDDVVVRRLSLKLAPPSGWNVLLVDDVEVNLHFLKRKLHQVSASHATAFEPAAKRWKITTCNDANKAKELLERESYDLVVLDECLSSTGDGPTGTDICEFARTKTRTNNDSIIVLNSGSSCEKTMIPLCFDEAWSKPLPSVETMRQDLSFQLIHSRGQNGKNKPP